VSQSSTCGRWCIYGAVILPGDTDHDGDVEFVEFSSLAGNFTGNITPPAPRSTGGKTGPQGDFDYDGDVDEDDRTSLINDLTGTIVPQIRMSGSGELAIEFTDGSMLLIADEDKNVFSRFSIRSPNG